MPRYITVAIHTYDRALELRALLEREGIAVELNNVNLEVPGFSSGVRVRIPETDLPLALRIIENRELFSRPDADEGALHTILVPVDLSETSFKAASVAADLAKASKSTITFLYSYIDPYVAGNVQFTDALTYEIGENGARAALKTNAEKLLHNFVERFRMAMKNGQIPVVKFSCMVVEGVPEDAIVDYAKDANPRLIVMGTREAKRKSDDMIGSVTAEVLDTCRLTVLSVPEPAPVLHAVHPSDILFFCNLDQDDILAMDALYRMYGSEKANVTIIHAPARRRYAGVSDSKALDTLSRYCIHNFEGFRFSTVSACEADIDTELERIQQSGQYSLVVVPNRRRSAFSRLFNRGIAHKVLFQTDIPMLVIPV